MLRSSRAGMRRSRHRAAVFFLLDNVFRVPVDCRTRTQTTATVCSVRLLKQDPQPTQSRHRPLMCARVRAINTLAQGASEKMAKIARVWEFSYFALTHGSR